MDTNEIILRIVSHPWMVFIMAATFVGCNLLAWRRIRRESSKDYRKPRLPVS